MDTESISTIDTSSDVLCKYEVSLVKCYDPGCIIFDVHVKGRDMITEMAYIKVANEKLTDHWHFHKEDPVEGRKYRLGEIVAVNVGKSWKAAMIVNFKIKHGLHYYDVVFLDTGHLVEVHRMDFRGIDGDVKIYHRFALFGMMDLIPAGEQERSYPGWSSEACHEMWNLFDLANSISITVMAKQTFSKFERLFGNIFITTGHHVIDVKEQLIENKSAYENPEEFRRFYKLAYEEIFVSHQEIPDLEHKLEEEKKGKIDTEEITDENLDKHLIEYWRREGVDPFTQQERLRVRHKLSAASRISFANPRSPVETVNDPALNQDTLNTFPRPIPEEAKAGAKKTKGKKFLLSMVRSRRYSSDETAKYTSDTDCPESVSEDMNQLKKPFQSGGYDSDEDTNSSRCDSEDYDEDVLGEQEVTRKRMPQEINSDDSSIHEFSEQVEEKFSVL